MRMPIVAAGQEQKTSVNAKVGLGVSSTFDYHPLKQASAFFLLTQLFFAQTDFSFFSIRSHHAVVG